MTSGRAHVKRASRTVPGSEISKVTEVIRTVALLEQRIHAIAHGAHATILFVQRRVGKLTFNLHVIFNFLEAKYIITLCNPASAEDQ